MATKDPRVDAYIAKSADFAKPILIHLRKLFHAACPPVQETIKWGVPSFEHKGPLGHIAAFKQHCVLVLWKGRLIFSDKTPSKVDTKGMGQFGRITALTDLPGEKVLLGYLRKAVQLNEAGIKVPATARSKKKELVLPDYFTAALKKNRKAQAAFDAFSYSHKKEYIEWITEAKRDETRAKRLETTLKWLAEGKPRHWKYR